MFYNHRRESFAAAVFLPQRCIYTSFPGNKVSYSTSAFLDVRVFSQVSFEQK